MLLMLFEFLKLSLFGQMHVNRFNGALTFGHILPLHSCTMITLQAAAQVFEERRVYLFRPLYTRLSC